MLLQPFKLCFCQAQETTASESISEKANSPR